MTTKNELISGVADDANVTREVAKAVVEATFGIIGDLLSAGDSVQISGFGKFDVKESKARQGRNPQTGEAINIPAGRRVVFKPAAALKDVI